MSRFAWDTSVTGDLSLYIWRFPEIGVPPNHPFLDGIFHYKLTILGIPHSRKPPLIAVDVAMAAMAPLGAQVIDSADLEADHALMDSGMDSLSGAAPTAKIWGNYSYSYWVVTYVVQKKSYVYIYIYLYIYIYI